MHTDKHGWGGETRIARIVANWGGGPEKFGFARTDWKLGLGEAPTRTRETRVLPGNAGNLMRVVDFQHLSAEFIRVLAVGRGWFRLAGC